LINFRKLTKDDLPFFLEIRNECKEFLHNNSHFSLKAAEDWFVKKSSEYFIIDYFGEEIGYFRTAKYRLDKNSIYIGADLHQKFRGKGFAIKAYSQFMKFLNENKGIEIFTLEVLSHNYIAIQLYSNLGFKVINRHKKYTIRANKNLDNLTMKLEYIDFNNS
jgi:RimJ/RimL family protein N-acetyltransferase